MNLIKSLLVKLLKAIGLRQVIALVWYKVIVPEVDKRVKASDEDWDDKLWQKIKEYAPVIISKI